MKSLEVGGPRQHHQGTGPPRYKIHQNRNRLEDSFNKIECLLKQTKDLQEQTKQLRCSSSSHLQKIKYNGHQTRDSAHQRSNKRSDNLSQDVGPLRDHARKSFGSQGSNAINPTSPHQYSAHLR